MYHKNHVNLLLMTIKNARVSTIPMRDKNPLLEEPQGCASMLRSGALPSHSFAGSVPGATAAMPGPGAGPGSEHQGIEVYHPRDKS